MVRGNGVEGGGETEGGGDCIPVAVMAVVMVVAMATCHQEG